MNRMNTVFYLIAVSVFTLLIILLPASMFLILVPMLLISVVGGLAFWFRAWRGIQDEETRITPGRAIGFLLIPLFNIYWSFRMPVAYPREYDTYCIRNGAERRELSLAAFHAWTFLAYMSLILDRVSPMIGYVTQIIVVVVQTVVIIQTCRAVNALVEEGKAAIGHRSDKSLEKPLGIG